jgi:lipid-binding SYLF domain-containing protein
MMKVPVLQGLVSAALCFFICATSASAVIEDTRIITVSKEIPESRVFAEQPIRSSRSFEGTSKITAATEVLQEILSIPETGIPPALLHNAYGIAIIPGVLKAAFILGARYGSGILLVHSKESGWSNPSFIKLYGGGIGWQIGAQSTDVILVFKTGKSTSGLSKGTFTLGADASVAAGPLGRSVEAATDAQLKAEIYSYSRNRGLFAGVSLEGASLQIDSLANASFYGKNGIQVYDIFAETGMYSPEVQKLRDLLTGFSLLPYKEQK